MFEGILVQKTKDLIVAGTSKFQIGGIPGHRSQEHLFCVKSVIELYSYLELPLYIQLFDISKCFDKEILKDAMDTLYKCGVRGKLYRLWYELYRDSLIRVKTAAGLSNEKSTGENVTQGSIGGAILSSANLDKTLSAYFAASDSEISYGNLRLSVLSFQDDTLRMVSSLNSAQKGNIFMNTIMKRKQLSLNIEKCSILVCEKKNRIGQIREAINKEQSLSIGNETVVAKEKDDYLGDCLHEAGLSKSVKITVDKRYGRVFSAMLEISAILEDYRIDSIGGLSAGLEIYELALLPSLLHNAETWTKIDAETEDKLEKLQNSMFRSLFGVPRSTPKPILRSDLGQLSVREKIHVKKLTFLHHLKSLPEKSLGSEFYNIQAKYEFPGLIKECKELIRIYQLPNLIDSNYAVSKECWKKLVKNAVKEKSKEKLKKEASSYSKLKKVADEIEELKMKDYVKSMTLRNARSFFRIRSQMVNVKLNFKSNKIFFK